MICRTGLHQAHEGVQAKTLGGEAGDGKGSIGTMDPPTSSSTLIETMIDFRPGSIGCPVCSPRITDDAPSKPVTDQPAGCVGALYEKKSIEYGVERAGKELTIMYLRALTLQSPTTNI